MDHAIPKPVKNAFRITLDLPHREARMDGVLLQALKSQNEHPRLKSISRSALKQLFVGGKIQIKGQIARPSSGLAQGVTYVDILQ